jgi:hypothetical protein
MASKIYTFCCGSGSDSNKKNVADCSVSAPLSVIHIMESKGIVKYELYYD